MSYNFVEQTDFQNRPVYEILGWGFIWDLWLILDLSGKHSYCKKSLSDINLFINFIACNTKSLQGQSALLEYFVHFVLKIL